jgi:glycerate 2-kinase
VQPPQDLLMQIFRAAVAACHPDIVVPRCLPPRPDGRVLVLGTGKASAAMAAAVETCWDAPLAGTVVTRYGHGAATRWIRVIEAQHPVPDAASRQAGGEILSLASGLSEEDTVLVLLSGGGSALMAAPLPSLDLETKQSLTRQLVLSGASISQINCVRKHLSAVKGGRLAARAFPARTLTIAISDVANDDPSVIASGPTVADPSTQRDALEILKKFRIDVPLSVQRVLEDARAGDAEARRPASFQIDVSSAPPAALISSRRLAMKRTGMVSGPWCLASVSKVMRAGWRGRMPKLP